MMDASSEHWGKVAPPIFGTLFQSSMDVERRHACGAHFTSEADIQKVVRPTIVRPWRERIGAASTLKELRSLANELLEFRVLDPACGSGNFLYVAYRELVNLEMEILSKIHTEFADRARKAVGTTSLVSTKQFYGIDIDPFEVELAKVTLMLAKRVALAETQNNWFAERSELPLEFENPLPLDNLDNNIRCKDALFAEWPAAAAIIGNPPYQSKNKMQQELGRVYVNRVRDHYPEVPGHADYCAYWFRRAHDELEDGCRAGLVGTNTIRQNYSREGGLDYIVENGGTITEAISSQVWSGDAAVHVSIVNWKKGEEQRPKKLFRQLGDNLDSPWEVAEVDRIGAALSGRFDVTAADALRANKESGSCDQGQTHGHKGFLLAQEEAKTLMKSDPKSHDFLKPYLTADEFLSSNPPAPGRYVMDFHPRSMLEARVPSGSQHWAQDRLASPGKPPFSRTGTSLSARCGRFAERSTTVCLTSIEIPSRRISIVADQRRKGLEHLHPQPHAKVYAVTRGVDRRGRQQAHRRSARDYATTRCKAQAGSRVNRGCWSRTNIAVADRHLLIKGNITSFMLLSTGRPSTRPRFRPDPCNNALLVE